MLILSRRPSETITFPNLGITIEVVRIKGQVVRLGVDAPASIQVLRGELSTLAKSCSVEEPGLRQSFADSAERSHHRRGLINSATMSLYVAAKQVQQGSLLEADATIHSALTMLDKLEQAFAVEAAPSRSPRALLVEDNPFERSLLESYLRLSGVEVDSVGDGSDAIHYLREQPHPDAVLLDLNMPRCDGPTTLATIRNNDDWSRLKVFIVSGMAEAESSLAVKPLTPDAWFRKPLNPAAIVRCMNEVVSA